MGGLGPKNVLNNYVSKLNNYISENENHFNIIRKTFHFVKIGCENININDIIINTNVYSKDKLLNYLKSKDFNTNLILNNLKILIDW